MRKLFNRRTILLAGGSYALPAHGNISKKKSGPSSLDRELYGRYRARLAGEVVLLERAFNPDVPVELIHWLNPASAIYPADQSLPPLIRRMQGMLEEDDERFWCALEE